jgi:hypothetical protein
MGDSQERSEGYPDIRFSVPNRSMAPPISPTNSRFQRWLHHPRSGAARRRAIHLPSDPGTRSGTYWRGGRTTDRIPRSGTLMSEPIDLVASLHLSVRFIGEDKWVIHLTCVPIPPGSSPRHMSVRLVRESMCGYTIPGPIRPRQDPHRPCDPPFIRPETRSGTH